MWKYCNSISQLGFFILYIIFLSFISFSSIHVSFLFFLFLVFLLHTSVQCPLLSLSPPSFIFFFTSRTFQQPHLLHIRERERDCYSSAAPPPVEIEVAERTKQVEISVHHAALPRPPPHCCLSSSPPPGWVRSACSFFFHICLFWFNFILRIGFCFVFCVWIMWEMERMREKRNPEERERINIIVASIIFKQKNWFGVAAVFSRLRELL